MERAAEDDTQKAFPDLEATIEAECHSEKNSAPQNSVTQLPEARHGRETVELAAEDDAQKARPVLQATAVDLDEEEHTGDASFSDATCDSAGNLWNAYSADIEYQTVLADIDSRGDDLFVLELRNAARDGEQHGCVRPSNTMMLNEGKKTLDEVEQGECHDVAGDVALPAKDVERFSLSVAPSSKVLRRSSETLRMMFKLQAQ